MATPRNLTVGDDWDGIVLGYVKRRRTLGVHGYYNKHVGIEGREIPLGEFLEALGITDADIAKARAERAAWKGAA